MIKATTHPTHYSTRITNGVHEAVADAAKAKGGNEAGFGPHELLEASSASCISIWLRMCATKHAIPLTGATVDVLLNRSRPGEAIFEYSIQLEGPLMEEQQTLLREMAKTCPVHQTLSRRISFREASRLQTG